MPHYKLKDKGTSYYDASQQKGIVSNRIEELVATPHVFQAVREGRIVLVEDENEIDEALKAQGEYDEKIAGTKEEPGLPNTAEPKAADEVKEPVVDETPEQKRTKLEADYKEATGEDAKPEQTDEDLTTAITAKADDGKGKTKAKKSLEDLAKE